MRKIWIGKRESDIQTYPYFDYSITFWGSNNDTNFSFCEKKRINSDYSPAFTHFVIKKLKELIDDSSDEYQIFFYNNSFAYKIIDLDTSLRPLVKNLNSVYIHNLLRHKTLSRLWLSNSVDVPAFASLSKHECKYEHLKIMFSGYERFVIQENYSGGGEGTYIISSQNADKVLKKLSDNKTFLISPYYENNISLSCTLMIDDYSSLIFPVSQQILIFNDHIRYCGNHYYKNGENISACVKSNAKKVGETLRNIGYRGICGLDWIYTNKKILLIEVNPRFQGSSFAINEALKRKGLPSLFELNNNCFTNGIPTKIKECITKLSIPFENHSIFLDQMPIKNEPDELIYLDGYDKSETFEDNVYLYRYISFPKET